MKKHTEEFKQEAVRIALTSGLSRRRRLSQRHPRFRHLYPSRRKRECTHAPWSRWLSCWSNN